MDKAIWPLGKDNPNCICDDNPNINCEVHVNRFPPTDKLDHILDTVFANGITKGQQYADGKGANTLTSDTLYSAKTALKQLISEAEIKAKIDELESLPEWGEYNGSYRQEIRHRLHALKQGKGKDE